MLKAVQPYPNLYQSYKVKDNCDFVNRLPVSDNRQMCPCYLMQSNYRSIFGGVIYTFDRFERAVVLAPVIVSIPTTNYFWSSKRQVCVGMVVGVQFRISGASFDYHLSSSCSLTFQSARSAYDEIIRCGGPPACSARNFHC